MSVVFKILESFWSTLTEEKKLTNKEKRQLRYGGNYLAYQAMISATGDDKRDKETYRNTVKNQTV